MSTEVYDDLEKSLKELYAEVSSPPAGLIAARARMLAEASELGARQVVHPLSTTQAGNTGRRRKMNLVLAYKALAAVLAVVMAIAGMGGGAVLATDALPGDFLYPMKVLSEDVRLILTPDPSSRAELEITFVGVRVQEMARLAQQGEDIPDAVVARLTRQMEQVMLEITKARPEEAPALLERVMDRTRLHQQVLEDVAAGSAAGTRIRLREASQVMECTRLNLENAAAGSAAETQIRLREAAQVMECTRLNGENDPEFLEHQHQYQYEGTPGPHGVNSPTPTAVGQQTQEQNQQGYQGTPGPHGEATPSPQQEQVGQEEQHRYEGTAGPDGQVTPTPTPKQVDATVPQKTTPPDTDPAWPQEEYQYRQEGTPGPHGEQSPPSGDQPEPTQTQQQGGNSTKGH